MGDLISLSTRTLIHWHIDTLRTPPIQACVGWLIGLRKRHRKVHDTKSRYENGAARRSSRCTSTVMREREYARGNVSVNVNANSNMPVIIISASTVARRPFPGSSWHLLSFASVARRWPRGSLINRNCGDPRWRTLNSQQLIVRIPATFDLENLIWNWSADVRSTNLKTWSRLTVEFLTLGTEE